jgi:hypothetical protein
MTYVLLAGVVLIVAGLAYAGYGRLRPAARANVLRWGLGGMAALATVALALARRIDLAAFTGIAAVSILRFGRLGPFNLGGSGDVSPNNLSKVRSRYFAMELDHDSGTVAGRVISGAFRGRDLMDLDEADTRALFAEIDGDADSERLLESWLDANRAGWREYFAASGEASGTASTPPADPDAEAYAVLGLSPGASVEQVKAAHRELMKGVHPDHGGSSYLAAKINQARDQLLKSLGAR